METFLWVLMSTDHKLPCFTAKLSVLLGVIAGSYDEESHIPAFGVPKSSQPQKDGQFKQFSLQNRMKHSLSPLTFMGFSLCHNHYQKSF